MDSFKQILLFFGITGLVVWGWDAYENYKNRSEYFKTDTTEFYKSKRREGWELRIYSGDQQYKDFEVGEFLGLSKDTCISEGLARTRNAGSYSCGYQCYTSETTFEDGIVDSTNVCKIICDKNGCRE